MLLDCMGIRDIPGCPERGERPPGNFQPVRSNQNARESAQCLEQGEDSIENKRTLANQKTLPENKGNPSLCFENPLISTCTGF